MSSSYEAPNRPYSHATRAVVLLSEEPEDDCFPPDSSSDSDDADADAESSFDPLDPPHDDSETDAAPNEFEDDFDDESTSAPPPPSTRPSASVLITTRVSSRKRTPFEDLRWADDLSETDTDEP